MRRTLPWIGLAAGIALVLAAAYATYQTADFAWNQIVDYESPFAEVDLPAASAGPALSDRVVLVIVDGMRDDISREMSAVENLRGYAEERGHSLLELAISWLVTNPVVPSVISGATKPEQVHANAAAAGWQMTPAERAEIDALCE